jgi:hypothetical protein
VPNFAPRYEVKNWPLATADFSFSMLAENVTLPGEAGTRFFLGGDSFGSDFESGGIDLSDFPSVQLGQDSPRST